MHFMFCYLSVLSFEFQQQLVQYTATVHTAHSITSSHSAFEGALFLLLRNLQTLFCRRIVLLYRIICQALMGASASQDSLPVLDPDIYLSASSVPPTDSEVGMLVYKPAEIAESIRSTKLRYGLQIYGEVRQTDEEKKGKGLC